MFTRFKRLKESNQRARSKFKKGFTPPPIFLDFASPRKMFFGGVAVSSSVSRRPGRLVGGFTLVELLVVLTIVLLLSTVSVSQYLPFVARSDYENVVLDVALGIRQYQLFGVGSVQTGANFDVAYGVRARTVTANDKIVFFADSRTGVNANSVYNGNATTCTGECVKMTAMVGYKVAFIMTDTGSTKIADITFKRPYLDTTIYTGAVPSSMSPSTSGKVSICIQPNAVSSAINYSKIVISRTGQVSVQATDVNCS